eukprot:CFRG5649T1
MLGNEEFVVRHSAEYIHQTIDDRKLSGSKSESDAHLAGMTSAISSSCSEPVIARPPLPFTTSEVGTSDEQTYKSQEIHQYSNVKEERNYLRIHGAESAKRSDQYFIPNVALALMLSLPFIIAAWCLDFPSVDVLILSTVPYVLNLSTQIAYATCLYHYRNSVLIRSRGNTFLLTLFPSVMILTTATYTVMVYMWYLYYSGQLSDSNASIASMSKHDGVWLLVVISVGRLAQTVFMASLSGRLSVFYHIFVKSPTRVLPPRKIRWIYWKPIIWLIILQIIVTIPYIITTTLTITDSSTSDLSNLTEAMVVAGMWIMALARGLLFLWFGIKTRHVEALYSDFHQNLRAGVLEVLIMISVSTIWTTVGITPWTVLYNELVLMMMGMSYVMDAFTIPIYLTYKSRHTQLSVDMRCASDTSPSTDAARG